ncbi:STAS domain-containing protein [uncultured Sulfitobacter sp.]|uniref:STAS domain-containing protein n=1 Tax=uncultured Sulfitobacter sp. TaxID=191468 RepID=UPI0030D79D23|tara:strand:+ start:84321 stop:84656 length:336 start_codon:yes stop_codon:yes gene_type:complete
MRLSAETEELLQVVTVLDDRIDAAVALEFKENGRQITETAPATVILDLSAVVFIDSSGLGAIVATMKHLAPQRTLVLAGLTAPVDRVFRLTRMDSVFSLYPTLSHALEDLS